MAWKFKPGLPIVPQITDRLRTEIINGVYPSGEPFPTVRTLAAEAAVNPNTMQRALSQLESEGLLVTFGTSGRCVTDAPEKIVLAKELTVSRFTDKYIKEAKALGLTREELSERIMKGWSENE